MIASSPGNVLAFQVCDTGVVCISGTDRSRLMPTTCRVKSTVSAVVPSTVPGVPMKLVTMPPSKLKVLVPTSAFARNSGPASGPVIQCGLAEPIPNPQVCVKLPVSQVPRWMPVAGVFAVGAATVQVVQVTVVDM